MTPRKHAETIKKWADGAEVQIYSLSRGEWVDVAAPYWMDDANYRIKPATVRFRNYLRKSKISEKIFVEIARHKDEPMYEEGFIKWLGDWQEVEV